MIRVLIVDDSIVQQELLTHVLGSDPQIDICGVASNGLEAIQKVIELKPDVVTMDIHMPKMDGIEATRKIMSSTPVPIIIISGTNSKVEIHNTFQAIEAGAVSIVEKINFVTDNKNDLIEAVKLMSEVKVVKRIDTVKKTNTQTSQPHKKNLDHELQVIAIGTSTGGPLILQVLFQHFPSEFPPVLVVQHISPGFIEGLAEWLTQTTHIHVKVAAQGEMLEPNCVYLAPDGMQMGLDTAHRINLRKDDPVQGHRPSVNYLFNSMAKTLGPKALGIILTGMGNDGASGLKQMKERGAMTIAQNEETSMIFGMPSEAIKLNAAQKILSPIDIASFIKTQLKE